MRRTVAYGEGEQGVPEELINSLGQNEAGADASALECNLIYKLEH